MPDPKPTKRLRIFAGPNGSGKSSVIKDILSQPLPHGRKIRLGYYINADDIEQEVKTNGSCDLSKYSITATSDQWHQFIQSSGFTKKGKVTASTLIEDTSVENRTHIVSKSAKANEHVPSYLSALIADFIRERLFEKQETFSFETVFSDPSKVLLMERAKLSGYKVYLYFICTGDPEINVDRVKRRVQMGGHDVREDKIRQRYLRSLEQIHKAWKFVYRAYFFDNSDTNTKGHILIAEINPSKELIIEDHNNVPDWFKKYFIDKL